MRRLLERALQLLVVVRLANAAPSAASRRLDEDRVPDELRDRKALRFRLDEPVAAGHGRNAARLGHGARGVFIAKELHRFDGRPDKFVAAVSAFFRKLGVFGEEPVTGMDRVDVGNFRGADDSVDFQVALIGPGGPNADGLVGQLQIVRAAVGFAVSDYRFDTKFSTRANDAQSDFAAISD